MALYTVKFWLFLLVGDDSSGSRKNFSTDFLDRQQWIVLIINKNIDTTFLLLIMALEDLDNRSKYVFY